MHTLLNLLNALDVQYMDLLRSRSWQRYHYYKNHSDLKDKEIKFIIVVIFK